MKFRLGIGKFQCNINRMRNSEIDRDELEALRRVEMLLAPSMPDHIRESLIEKGLIEQKLGGLMRTSEGNMYLRKHGR